MYHHKQVRNFQLWLLATSLGLLTIALLELPTRAQVENPPIAEPDVGLTREQWREHVEETKRRVQQEAAQRRREGTDSRAKPSQEDVARRASESVVNDDSLLPGDIIVTDKGKFVFRGRSKEPVSARNFELIEGPAGLEAK